jgi:hypothetical protein
MGQQLVVHFTDGHAQTQVVWDSWVGRGLDSREVTDAVWRNSLTYARQTGVNVRCCTAWAERRLDARYLGPVVLDAQPPPYRHMYGRGR